MPSPDHRIKPYDISFSNKYEFHSYEKILLIKMCDEMYQMGGGFYQPLQREYNKVCITKGIHRDDGETIDHFNFYFFNDNRSALAQIKHYTAIEPSTTYHIYINDKAEPYKMTSILTYNLRP